MNINGASSINKQINGNLSQPKLRVLLPKNNIFDLDSLYQSLTIKKGHKQSTITNDEGYKAHRFITLNPKKTFRSKSQKEIALNNNRTWRYSQKKVNQIQEQSSQFITIPQPQISQRSEDQWSLKCSCILTALKNSRVSFENRSKQKRQIFVRIKSMHKQFDRQKNILMRKCVPKRKAIQALKQQFSSGIACKTIVPLYVSWMANKHKTKVKNKQVTPEVKMEIKANLNNSRYRDIPISKFIYQNQDQKIINDDLQVKLQKISRYPQKKTNRGWVSLGQKDYRN